MSIDYDGTGDRTLSQTGLSISASPLTVAVRYYKDADVDSLDRIFTLEDSSFTNVVSCYTSSSDGLVTQFRQSGNSTDTIASISTTGEWHTLVFRQLTSTTFSIDFDGVSERSGTTVPGSLVMTNSYDRASLAGRYGAGTQCLDGRIADVGIWNVALTDDEVASYMAGMVASSIRPGSLYEYISGLFSATGAALQTLTLSSVADVALSNDNNPPLLFAD